jgi:signal transduction histidine kinase
MMVLATDRFGTTLDYQPLRFLRGTTAKNAQPESVVLSYDLPAGAEVFADPLIVKVFFNLMDNAVRYGSKIKTIRFSAEESGDDHIIICEDDGVGIPVEKKKKIFDRGFGKNTGLGLFLAREILGITGITIRETGEPGKGARCELHIPASSYRMNPVADNGTAGEP